MSTLSSTSSGYDGSMLNGLQIIGNWKDDMSHPTGAILGALSNGVVLVGLFQRFCLRMLRSLWKKTNCGRGADSRHYWISFTRGIHKLCILPCFTNCDWGWDRFNQCCFALFNFRTIISKIQRDLYIFYNTFWYLGAAIAAWVIYFIHGLDNSYSWRVPSYLQGLLPLIQTIGFYWVPESPRYLISKGEIEKASRILRKYHTGNDYSERATKLVEFEVQEISAALESEKISSTSNYLDFLTFPSYRRRLFLVFFTAFLCNYRETG